MSPKEQPIESKFSISPIISIKEVIELQKTNGSWDNEKLFYRMFPKADEKLGGLVK